MDQSSKEKIEKLKEERAQLLAKRDRVRAIPPVSPVITPEDESKKSSVIEKETAVKITETKTPEEINLEKKLGDADKKYAEAYSNFRIGGEAELGKVLRESAGAHEELKAYRANKLATLRIPEAPKEHRKVASKEIPKSELKENEPETEAPDLNEKREKNEIVEKEIRGGEVADFVNEFNLGPLLPKEFEALDELQKFKVIRDLKRRIVDIVKSDAQTQYSETLKEKSFIKSIVGSVTKERDVKNLEKKVFEELKNTDEGKKLIADDLKMLTQKTKEQEIGGNLESGFTFVQYLKDYDSKSKEETLEIPHFNVLANEFAKMPYEWGQEKSGKHKKEYDQVKADYDKAKEKILEIKSGKEEIKGMAMLEILEIDNALQMEQLLNTHPEFERALGDFEESANGLEWKRTGKNFLKSITLERGGLMAGGAGLRTLAKGAALLTGLTGITFLAAPVVGGVIGRLRGRMRAKDTLKERQKGARRGQKDESKEATNMVDAENLNKRLEEMIEARRGTLTNPEEEVKRIDQLKRRIEYTQNKIESGLVNFGNSKTALTNQYNLINNLNKAMVITPVLEGTTRKDIDERLERFLSYKTKNISEAQNKFIKTQAIRGMYMGAGFATAGYTLRWAGEHFGWWENLGKHMPWHQKEILFKNEPVHSVASSPATSAPNEMINSHMPENSHGLVSSHVQNNIKGPGLHAPVESTATPAINNFAGESIKFEHGKGGIKGILDLKNQMRAHYNNDFSKAPESVQKFMADHDVTRQAIKLGLYDPSRQDESALIREGSVLKFDEDGNLLFGKPDASGNIPILEKYHDAMFHSGHHESIADTVPGAETIHETPTLEENLHTPAAIDSEDDVPWVNTPNDTTEGSATEDDLREKILEQYNTDKTPPGLDQVETENLIAQASHTPAFAHFANNPLHLSGTKLIEAFNASQQNIDYLFGWNRWTELGNLKAGEIIKHVDIAGGDPLKDRLGECLRQLRFFSRLKPEGSGWFETGEAETVEEYMARAFQKLVKNGGLRLFEESMKDIRK